MLLIILIILDIKILKVKTNHTLILIFLMDFCLQRFPIYTQRAMEVYMGKRRNEVPPHIFAIAEGAFQGMMVGGKNQSILIT